VATAPQDKLGPAARTLRDIDLFLRAVPGARADRRSIREALEAEAQALVEAHAAGLPFAPHLIRRDRYRPGKSACTDAELLVAPLSLEQAREAVARWHLFPGWAEAASASGTVDPSFEGACDAIVTGDLAALRALLKAQPSLVDARSPFPHHATLLQHVAANGIENHRQWQSPENAVEVAELLLEAGSEPDAPCDAYSGGWTAMTLLVTSGHPAAAGVQADLVEVLCRHGAKPNGPEDDGAPLWWALGFFYTAAADRLVHCGARVDNLLFAAAAGDLEAVKCYFDSQGHLRGDRAHCWGRSVAPSRKLDADHMLDYALIYASAHGRCPVVELLLTKGPDLQVKDPMWKNTALDAAQCANRPEMIARLAPHYERAKEGGQSKPDV
jgi:ankyrin repeat protein